MSKSDIEEQLSEEVMFASMGQQVLNNEAYKQAIMTRKAHLFDVFCKTSKDQEDVREEAWRTMKNLEALELYFEEVLITGKMAEQQLEQLRVN